MGWQMRDRQNGQSCWARLVEHTNESQVSQPNSGLRPALSPCTPSCLHHQPLLLDAPGLLGDDVAEFGEGRLGSDVVAGDNPRVEEGLARGVEAAHAARDALRRAHDDHAAVGGVPDQRQDVGAVTAA